MKTIQNLSVWIATHPAVSVSVLCLGVLLCLGKVHTLEIEASTSGLMDEKDPKKDVYEDFKVIFGSDILTVVIIEGKDPQAGVFNEDTLLFVETLTDAVRDLEGVTSVTSLTTVNNIRGEGEYLNTDPLVDGVPEDEEELAIIRRNALENPIFPANVVSRDGRYAAINIYTDGVEKNYDRNFLSQLEALLEEHQGEHATYQVGAPRFNTHFNNSIEKDQMTLIPAAVLAILLVLFLVFRDPVTVSLPVITGGISIMATVGFMAWMGYSIGVVSVMVPSILIVVGCTEDVHMIAEFYHFRREGKSVNEAIIATASHSAVPITLTSLTTILGFGALGLNDITALKEFGIIACFGLFANFLITITVVPAVFRLTKKVPALKETAKGDRAERLLDWVIEANSNHRGRIALITGAVLFLAVVGCFRLQVNNDPISFFKESSGIRKDFSQIHHDLAGAQSFNIVFEAQEPGDIKEPEVLKAISELQAFMGNLGSLDKIISLADFVKTMHREMNNNPDKFVVPDDRDTIAEYLLLLENDDLYRYVDGDQQRANVMVRHNKSGSRDIGEVLAQIEAYINTNIGQYVVDGEIRQLKWYITGEAILLHSATDAMVSGQVKSLGMALLAILAIISLLFMSLKAGSIALVSNMVPILLNFGVMGWLGIPFNSGTCLVATIALGIAVDDTIHFMVRYQKELRNLNDQQLAMAAAIRAEGRPIATTSFALALGFSVMMLSQFIPSVHLGFLSALIMVYALVTDMFVNPVMLLTIQLVTLWDYVALKISEETRKASLFFRDLTEQEIKKVILLGSLRTVERDQMVIQEGESGSEMYLILSGIVRVFLDRNRDHTLITLTEGQILGEMALFGEGKRSASAEALFDVELLCINDGALKRIFRYSPRIAAKLYINLARILSARMVATTLKTTPKAGSERPIM